MKRLLFRLICVCVALLMFAAMIAGCSNDSEKSSSSASSATSDEASASVEPTEKPVPVYDIKTDYCTLKYPEIYKDKVKTEISKDKPYTVKFLCGKDKLFDISFNGGAGVLVGSISNNGKKTEVYLNMHPISPKAENYKELKEMSGASNVIIDYLEQDYSLESGAIGVDTSDVFEIETSVAKLYYPTQWKDSVKIDVEDGAVRFTSGNVKLFDLIFGESDESLLGTYDGTEIHVVSYDIDNKDITEGEHTRLLAMQDGVNVILENLQKDAKFKLA